MHSIIKERLQLIFHHRSVIQNRIDRIQKAEKLKNAEHGQMVLDSLITRLQALNENIIEKLSPSFFQNNLHRDIVPIIRFRDLASHHYELLNHNIIFSICKYEIPPLKAVLESYHKINGDCGDGN